MVSFLSRLPLFSSVARNGSPSPNRTVGHSGTAVFGGFVQTTEKNAELIGRERYKTFSEILANTSVVAAGTRYFLNLVSKADWAVDPAQPDLEEEPTDEAKRIADLVEFAMHDMETPWHRIVRRAAMYRFYGFSIQEWTAKEARDGSTNYLDIAPRPQITIEQWDTDVSGKVFGVVQRSAQTFEEIYIPRAKVIYVVDDSISDSPEGLGLFRHITGTAKRLERYEQLEGFGFDNDLRGIPIGRAPFAFLEELVVRGKISAAEKIAIEKPLRDFIAGHTKTPELGLLLDSLTYASEDDAATPSQVRQWDMELLKSGNTSQEAVAAAIERLNREIARTLGVEQLLLGERQGSFALARDKTQAFAAIVDSSLQEMSESFEKDFLDPLFLLNGWDEDLRPSLRTKSINLRDVLQVTQALKDMAAAGHSMDVTDPAIVEVRDLLGLSHPDMERLLEKEEADRAMAAATAEAAIAQSQNPNGSGRSKEEPEGAVGGSSER